MQEIELDGVFVELATEIDQVGLDLADLLAERDVGANVASAGQGGSFAVNEGVCGVDAVGRDQGIDAVEIRGRKPEPRASTCAMGDHAANPVGAPEQPLGPFGMT